MAREDVAWPCSWKNAVRLRVTSHSADSVFSPTPLGLTPEGSPSNSSICIFGIKCNLVEV